LLGYTPNHLRAQSSCGDDEVAEEIIAYVDSKGWDAAECINRIGHAHSLVYTQVGKGPKFDRSKDITNLCVAAIKHIQMMRDTAR
jgi:hypothetical protein